jgi:hypothetical protein
MGAAAVPNLVSHMHSDSCGCCDLLGKRKVVVGLGDVISLPVETRQSSRCTCESNLEFLIGEGISLLYSLDVYTYLVLTLRMYVGT